MYASPISPTRLVDSPKSPVPISAMERMATLANAIVAQDLDTVRAMLQEDPTLINAHGEHGDTPLHIALRSGAGIDLVDLLLDYRPDVAAANGHGDTCLHVLLARRPPAPQLVDRLLERGRWRANAALGCMRGVNLDGRDALAMANEADRSIASGYEETVAKLEATLMQCEAGLHQSILAALKAGDTDALKQIITTMQWEMHCPLPQGFNVVQLAMLTDNMKNVSAVLDLVAQTHNASALNVWTPTATEGRAVPRFWVSGHDAAGRNVDVFTSAVDLLATGRDGLEVRNTAGDDLGMAPLIWAVASGDVALVSRLLALGADVNFPALGDVTALHIAAYYGDYAMVEVLLDHGARPNCPTHIGRTPLMNAAARGHMDVVRLLQKRGADINAADLEGNTALILALETQPSSVHAKLIDAGAAQDVLVTRAVPTEPAILINGWPLTVDREVLLHVDVDRGRTCTLL